MNHMAKVAHMLGLELNENFHVKLDPNVTLESDYRFTEKGLMRYHKIYEEWEYAIYDTFLHLLDGKYEVVKLPKSILSEKEKKYHSDFIDPFKSQVTYIEKRYLKDFKGNEKEFISIGIKENEKYWRQMELPLYDAGKHYKGMEIGKEYSIKDLGL